VVLVVITAFVLHHHCPASGLAITSERREFHRLKNRTTLPQPADFDARINLLRVLEPGDDLTRWSVARAGRVEGYVVSVANARPELANCYCDRDVHVHIGLRSDAPPREHMVLEVTPRMRRWARHQGWNWSAEKLQTDLIGHWVRFEGWLFVDTHHAKEAENTAPGAADNWRATAWEIHPITKIQILK